MAGFGTTVAHASTIGTESYGASYGLGPGQNQVVEGFD